MNNENENQYQDYEIQCACGNSFIFTARDQEFFAAKNFAPPKRCRNCRMLKKQAQQERRQY